MIFSYPRCRYPISGFASVTVSPSTLTFMFQRPWVIGCCGPMLIQNSGTSLPPAKLAACDVLAVDLLGEVLSQRVELEVRREEDPLQVRMALVFDPHEVPGLSLVIVRCVPQSREARDLRIVVRDPRGHLDHAPVVVILDVVDAFEVIFPVDRGDAGQMLEPERVLQVRAERDQVLPVDRDGHDPRSHDRRGLEVRSEGGPELSEDLRLDAGHRPATHLRQRRFDRAHIWMTSSFLSAYWVATNMIPRNTKIEHLATGDEELRRPPHAKAQRRRNTAAKSKTRKISENMSYWKWNWICASPSGTSPRRYVRSF